MTLTPAPLIREPTIWATEQWQHLLSGFDDDRVLQIIEKPNDRLKTVGLGDAKVSSKHVWEYTDTVTQEPEFYRRKHMARQK